MDTLCGNDYDMCYHISVVKGNWKQNVESTILPRECKSVLCVVSVVDGFKCTHETILLLLLLLLWNVRCAV